MQTLTLSSGYPFDPDPPQREHGGMVVDVQEGDLVAFLPSYEEHGVKEFNQLADVVPPQCLRNLPRKIFFYGGFKLAEISKP